jgi:hypothetical protein
MSPGSSKPQGAKIPTSIGFHALFSVTAIGMFAATVAEKDHAAHAIIGEPIEPPLASAAYGGEHLAI